MKGQIGLIRSLVKKNNKSTREIVNSREERFNDCYDIHSSFLPRYPCLVEKNAWNLRVRETLNPSAFRTNTVGLTIFGKTGKLANSSGENARSREFQFERSRSRVKVGMSVIFHRSKNINMAIRIFIRISGIKWPPVAIIVRLTNWARSFFSPPSPLSPPLSWYNEDNYVDWHYRDNNW